MSKLNATNAHASIAKAITSFIDASPVNSANFTAIITNNEYEIIKHFGGLTNMINLCLTNPSAPDSVTTDNLAAFTSLLSKNNIDLKLNTNKSETQLATLDANPKITTLTNTTVTELPLQKYVPTSTHAHPITIISHDATVESTEFQTTTVAATTTKLNEFRKTPL